MRSNITKYIFILIVIILLITAAFLIYGNRPKENVGFIQKEEEQIEMITNLRIPIVEFDTINPIISKNQNIQDISRLIYEPLLNITPDGKINLCLAKEWTKQNGTSYVIKLKDNIKWQDGKLLTSKDVQFTMDRIKDANTNSIYAYQVQEVIGIEIIDDTTIKINLANEVPFFEYNLTFPIMPYHYFENKDFLENAKDEYPIGIGRFEIIKEGEKVFLKQNKNWWNIENDPTKLTEIEIIKFANMGEVYNAFKIGNIDLLTTRTLNVEDYIGTIGYQKKEYLGGEIDYIAFNCENKVLANIEVRKAIMHLIDKNNIVSGIYKEKYQTINFPVIGNNTSYLYEKDRIKYEYNQEQARQILESAEWNLQKKTWQKIKDYRTQRLRFDMIVNIENEKRVQVAENIKNTLEDFGININLRKVNNNQYLNYLKNKNYDIIITGVYSGFSPDISYYFGENNIANFYNEEINQIIDEVKNIQEERVLKEKYERIIQIYEENIPYVFLYQNKNTLIYRPNLVGDINPNRYNVYEGIGSWYRQ